MRRYVARMGVVGVLAKATTRTRRWSLAGLAVLVAFGLGVSLAAFAVAARTDRAYDRYLRDAEVGELAVNPSLSTARAAEIIGGTRGVREVATDDVLTATLDDGRPRTQAEVDSAFVQVRVSMDGRYVRQDRPVIIEGRMIRDGAEAFLSREAAEEFDLEVGDPVPLAFWFPSFNTPGIGAAQDDVVEALGRTEATVVGIGVFADEVLEDHLYPRTRVVVTPEVGRPFTCVIGDLATMKGDSIAELAAAVPRDCSLSYRYFSLRVDGGTRGAAAVADALVAAFNKENERLPPAAREADIGYTLIATFAQDQRTALARASAPGVTALRLFGLAAGVATVVLALLTAFRVVRRARVDALVWRQLGVPRRVRTEALAIALVVAVVTGVAGALAIGWIASAVGPVGSAAVVETGTRLELPWDVVAAVGGAALGFLLTGVVVVAASLQVTGDDQASRSRIGASRRLRPASGLGVQAATTGGSAGVVLLGGIVAVAVVTASAVFSANLSTLLREPARYGWPYDAAVIVGFGYGGSDDAAIARALDRPDVERWGLAALPTVAVDGRTVAAVASRRGFDGLRTPVLRGRYPTGTDEIAVGTQTLAELDADLGDQATVSSYYGDRTATITGTVVLPAIGPYESNRADSGRGALLSAPFFAALVTEAEAAGGLEPGSLEATGLSSLVAIDLADGVRPDRFLADLGDRAAWDRNGFESLALASPIRPSALDEASTLQRVPLALGGLLAVAMAMGLALGVAIATRARQREIAILRALGCSARDVRRSVRWHALTVVVVSAVVGLPLGVVAGRVAARAFLVDLGVSDAVVVPLGALTLVALGALGIGLTAAVGPAHVAAAAPASTGREA
jgi:hypothetical protein